MSTTQEVPILQEEWYLSSFEMITLTLAVLFGILWYFKNYGKKEKPISINSYTIQ